MKLLNKTSKKYTICHTIDNLTTLKWCLLSTPINGALYFRTGGKEKKLQRNSH